MVKRKRGKTAKRCQETQGVSLSQKSNGGGGRRSERENCPWKEEVRQKGGEEAKYAHAELFGT